MDAALARRGGMEDAPEEGLSGLEPRDRAFARALALATLRHLGPIDHALAQRMKKAPPPQVQRLLRIGVAQLLFLDTPPHAAVATTLDLAAPDPSAKPFTKLMNAVLRGLDRERPEVTPDQYAPDWLYARWRAAYGEEGAQGIAAAIAAEPPTDLSLKPSADAETLCAELPGVLLPGGKPAHRTARGCFAMAGVRGGGLVGARRRRRHPGAPVGPQSRHDRPRPVRRAGRQDDATGRHGSPSDGPRPRE